MQLKRHRETRTLGSVARGGKWLLQGNSAELDGFEGISL